MPPLKSVKKVEIAEETVVDLKSKEKSLKPKVSFAVHKISEDFEQEVPIQKFDQLTEEPKLSIEEIAMERSARIPKYDPEALQQRMESFAEKLEKAVIKVAPAEGNNASSSGSSEPKDLIKVKFDKFVQLVASRDFVSVLERNKDEVIVMSSNLLTELAGSMEEKSEKKTPVFFLVGLAIGVIITYLLINR